MSPLRLAWLTLTRKKFSSLIAILSIALSVASSGLLLRLYLLSESRFATLAQGSDAIVGAKAGGIEILLNAFNSEGPYPGYLPQALFESLRAGEKVHFSDGVDHQISFAKTVIPFIYFGKVGETRAIGTDESFFRRETTEKSLNFKEGAWSTELQSLVVGSAVALKKNLHIGDTLPLSPWAGQEVTVNTILPFKVVGILAPTGTIWDHSVFSSVETAQAVLGTLDLSQKSIWGNKVLNYFLIDLKPGGRPALTALIDRRTVGQAIFVEDEKDHLKELSGVSEKLGLSLTVLILFLGSLCVASMLLSRFEGMLTQLAVLRALGYQKMFLWRWLLCEGLILGFVACVLGACVDGVLFPFLRESFGQALPANDLVASNLWQSWPVWLTALVSTMAAVFLPMLRLTRQSIHLSLRG